MRRSRWYGTRTRTEIFGALCAMELLLGKSTMIGSPRSVSGVELNSKGDNNYVKEINNQGAYGQRGPYKAGSRGNA